MVFQETKTQESKGLSKVLLLVILALGAVVALGALTGCNASTQQEAESADQKAEEAGETTHELVCLPTVDYGITDFFGQEYLWGTEIEGVRQLLIVHFGEGGIVNKEGQPVDEKSLKPGDIIECSFDMIAQSYPGQVSVDQATLIEEAGSNACIPYYPELEELQRSAVDVDNEVE